MYDMKYTKIEIINTIRISTRKEEINCLINGIEYFGYVVTFGENWTKKYVQFLRRSQGVNQASYSIKIELENYLNSL